MNSQQQTTLADTLTALERLREQYKAWREQQQWAHPVEWKNAFCVEGDLLFTALRLKAFLADPELPHWEEETEE